MTYLVQIRPDFGGSVSSVERMGETRNADRIVVGKPERKDNIKIDYKGTECEDVDWIHPTQVGSYDHGKNLGVP